MESGKLPIAYLDLMREIMGTDYEAWTAALEAPLFRVVRLNPTKIDEQAFLDEFPDAERLEKYPGFLYRMPANESSLGNHPFHHAGCFYIQEPSASLPVVALCVEKDDKVLDCCAAPGGKSTQILSELDGTGLLVSNEIDSKRNQTLRFNLQRFGEDNLLVTQNDTFVLGSAFRGYFDKILIDAPCSGMGMFRKDPSGIKYFSQKNIDHCVRMQKDILENVYPALKENGILVYSTCTFTFEENEDQIASFIERHPDMIVEELPFTIGRPGISKHGELTRSRRITLLEGGEGHYIFRLRKTGTQTRANITTLKPSQDALVRHTLDAWLDVKIPSYELNGHIYLSRTTLPTSEPIRITQAGVHLGEIVKGRIDPDQAFATSKIARDAFIQKQALTLPQTLAYLRGETLPIAEIRGFVLLTYRNQAIGFAKGDGNILKNHFPKGIRSFQRFSENGK
jgi:16S rRNA C967 or C1407 C5-methylase (RsmB/RsmF family)/NOL1/NOP2/fmu family ribosome biogenesis protein